MYADRTYHEGHFSNNKFWLGKGTVKYKDGTIYEGNQVYGKPEGYGKLTNADGSISHVGKWIND